MISQEALDTALRHELATKGSCVEQLTVGIAVSLHLPIFDDRPPNREHLTAIIQCSRPANPWSRLVV